MAARSGHQKVALVRLWTAGPTCWWPSAPKKAPLELAGLELRGRELACPASFGRFSSGRRASTGHLFGCPLGSISAVSSDCWERGRCVAAMFGVHVVPAHEEPRKGSNKSEHESTSDHSTNCGSGHLIRVFRDIGRIFSLLLPSRPPVAHWSPAEKRAFKAE
jgi:hypothetical protein